MAQALDGGGRCNHVVADALPLSKEIFGNVVQYSQTLLISTGHRHPTRVYRNVTARIIDNERKHIPRTKGLNAAHILGLIVQEFQHSSILIVLLVVGNQFRYLRNHTTIRCTRDTKNTCRWLL